MRFATRTFLGSFIPFAVLLAISFLGVRAAVGVAVRDRLRASTRESQVALTKEQARNEGRTRRMLRGIAENPTLKAGLQLLTSEKSAQEQARNTVRDQLSEMADGLEYDFMMVAGARGEALAAVVREAGGFSPLDVSSLNRAGTLVSDQRYFGLDDRLYEVTSVPVNEDNEQVATLTVGARLDISRFGLPAVLLHNGSVVTTVMRDLAPSVIESALRACPTEAECLPRIQDQTYLSIPLSTPLNPASGITKHVGYELRSLQNVDAASAPIQSALQKLFLVSGALALIAALAISAITSRSVARPLADVAGRLRQGSATGELPRFPESSSHALEIRELTQGFNQAAEAVSEGRQKLTRAYVEFVGSMAQALDARDAYTAGHSRRVSDYSCAIGRAMGLPKEQIETIRIGALLHDLGKIGIADSVLQKPGRLTPEEEALIRQHPVIGRRILEKVHGMEPYLGMVELHHENWNGTGYPRGLRQEETPLHARIVKVADAYDAMTSDRPYRRGRTHGEALAVLHKVSGTETDPAVVKAFASLGDLAHQQESRQQPVTLPPAPPDRVIEHSLQSLATAVTEVKVPQEPESSREPVGALSGGVSGEGRSRDGEDAV